MEDFEKFWRDLSLNMLMPQVVSRENIREMPRSKRRTTSYDVDEERIAPKKQRGAHLQTNNANSRRYNTRSEEVFNHKRCLSWFHKYTSASDPDVLGPDGMEKFCIDIGVKPEDIVMLVLAYKMGARQMGFFSQYEWLRGLTELQCDSAAKMHAKLDYLKELLNDPQTFRSVYRYSYDFAKESDQRSMDITTAKGMLQVLLGNQWSLCQEFGQFLDQSKYKVINKDQWSNILEFSRTIDNDLANYDVDGAWPVMLDEFVEWLRQRYSSSEKIIDRS